MSVVATVGLPGSGKTEAAGVAEEMGLRRITMGDAVRREIERRGLSVTDDNMAAVSTDLRDEHGEDAVAQLCLDEFDIVATDDVFVDGIRSWEEVQLFKLAFSDEFIVIHVAADFETRFKRISSRGRSEDIESRVELAARDRRELNWGLEKAIERADIVVRNEDDLASFHEAIRETLERYVA
jgi:dephospho-CoA kinase